MNFKITCEFLDLPEPSITSGPTESFPSFSNSSLPLVELSDLRTEANFGINWPLEGPQAYARAAPGSDRSVLFLSQLITQLFIEFAILSSLASFSEHDRTTNPSVGTF